MRRHDSELREQVTWLIIWLLALIVVIGLVVLLMPSGGRRTFQPIPVAPISVR